MKKRLNATTGSYIAIGIGVGTALGVAMGNIALGIALGIAIGGGIATAKQFNETKNSEDEQEGDEG